MDLIVIAHYTFAHEAKIAQATLEAAGITAYIRDENHVQLNWLYDIALGGVKLQVEEQDVQAATAILEMDYSSALEAEFPSEEGEGLVCPLCESHEVEYVVKGKDGVFLSALVLGAPVLPFSRGYRCLRCGNFWKKGSKDDAGMGHGNP